MFNTANSGKIFSKEQKIGLVLLSCFTVLAIGLGFLQIRNVMYGPLALNNAVPSSIRDEVVNPDYLRYRDTDHDGMSDFDELYIYGTSQYLADTDSDAIPDKQEVEQGTNPNCDETNSDCGNMVNNPAWQSTNSTLVVPLSDPGPAPSGLNDALNDPVQLRALLKQSGMTDAALKQISDSELLNLVKEFMKSSSTSPASLISGGATSSARSN
ncbi:MAG: hypothetical protein Q7S66_01120 [bacterium]|nr:hypothetical protein [bacterium]